MKKFLIPVVLGLLCAPLGAEPPLREFVTELGYSDNYIMDSLPKEKTRQRTLANTPKSSNVQPQRDLMQPKDLLYPRIFQKSESAEMIPVLMRYHRANPTSDKITRKLAVTCLKTGQYREALYWYTQTFQRDRSDLESLWNIAAIYYNLGETRQTKKYLEEYTKLDPNSAWGRMAREFIAGRFSGSDLSDGFAGKTGRVGMSGNGVSGASDSGGAAGNGIMVVEGKRYEDVETFFGIPDKKTEIGKPKRLNDTLKGKSGATASDKKAGKKLSLENAVITEKSASATEDVAAIVPVMTIATATPPLIP